MPTTLYLDCPLLLLYSPTRFTTAALPPTLGHLADL
jgi:hypothetical protein